jgi:hypothetical protein
MFDPGEKGQRFDFLGVVLEPDTLCGDQVLDLLKSVERLVSDGKFQLGDHRLSGGQFRRIRRKGQEEEIGRHLEFLAGVPTGLIKQQDDELLLVWIDGPAELVQRDLHQWNADTREDQEIALSREGFDKNVGIEPLILTALSNDGPLTLKRPEALQHRFQTKAPFILHPQPHLFFRVRGPCGSQGRFDFLIQIACSSGVAACT